MVDREESIPICRHRQRQNWQTYHDKNTDDHQKNINQYTAVAPKCHCTLSTSTHCDWRRARRFGGSVKVATAGCFHPPAGEPCRLLFSPLSLSDNIFSTVSGNGSGDRTSGDSKGIAFGVSPEAAAEKDPVAAASILSSWRDAGACLCSLVGAFPPTLGLASDLWLWAEPLMLAVSIRFWLGICCLLNLLTPTKM